MTLVRRAFFLGAPDSQEESWASGGRPAGLHQRAVNVGSPPRRLAAFSRAPPGSKEGVGAGVPGGQEQPSLGVTGRSGHWGDGWQGRAGAVLRLAHGAVSRGQGGTGRPGESETLVAGPGEGSPPAEPSGSSCLLYGGEIEAERAAVACWGPSHLSLAGTGPRAAVRRSLRRPQAPLRLRQPVLAARRCRGGRGGPP